MDKLGDFLDGIGMQHFLHYLMNFDPTSVGFTWRAVMDAPETKAKRKQIEMSTEVSDEFFLELLRFGRFAEVPPQLEDFLISWPLHEKDEEGYFLVRSQTLKSAFSAYCKYHEGSSAKFSRQKFGALFERYLSNKMSLTDMSKSVYVGGRTER